MIWSNRISLKAKCILFLVVFLSFFQGFGQAQEKISLQATVDRATITIGDLITYSVSVIREKDVEVRLPSLGENLGGFEIRDYKIHDPQKEDGRLIERIDYIISTFETGEFEIPPVEIRYKVASAGEEKVLKTEGIKIVVKSVKPSEEGDIREIKPPREIPYNWNSVILFGAVGLSALLLALGIIYYFRKKRRGEALLPRRAEPPCPPHEVAYERIRRLSESGLLEKGKVKRYYSEISEIIRRYVEGRYRIAALELTSSELLRELTNASLAEEHVALFVEFLELCDLVKFAKYLPTDKESEAVTEWAVRIVDETKHIEEVTEEKKERM